MGCSSSKRARIVQRRPQPAALHRSMSAPGSSARRKGSGCGGATITPLRLRFDSMAVKERKKDQFLDEKELRRTMTENRQRPDMSLEVFQAKTWSAMVGRKLSGGPIMPVAVLPPPAQAAEEKNLPDIITAWELMAELAGSSTSASSFEDNSSCSDTGSSMGRPASPEYNSVPEIGSLRYSPGSSQSSENRPVSPECLSDSESFSHSPESATSPKHGPSSPECLSGVESFHHSLGSAMSPENGPASPDLSEFSEPKWDLVDQDESLPSELDACFISVFAKSSEISPELEDLNNEAEVSESETETEITLSSPHKDENDVVSDE